MPKQKVFVSRLMAREALDMITGATEAEIWPDELPSGD